MICCDDACQQLVGEVRPGQPPGPGLRARRDYEYERKGVCHMHSQCLDRRLASQSRLADEVAAWESERNARKARIHWTFTLATARRKLRKLYPSIED